MANDALHIWPRGNFMLIALPNSRRQLHRNAVSAEARAGQFRIVARPRGVEQFLTQNFPDARELMPDALAEFSAHPVGFLGTVSAQPWHFRDQATLIGDAAHAMVPFHGQGMNCCFEDCIEFDACVARHASWEAVFADFGAARKPNTDAIAAMALENYMEMRESVADRKFQLQQALSLELERRFPRRFIPRYSMVMFHHEIPYLRRAAARRSAGADPVRSDARRGRYAVARSISGARSARSTPACRRFSAPPPDRGSENCRRRYSSRRLRAVRGSIRVHSGSRQALKNVSPSMICVCTSVR